MNRKIARRLAVAALVTVGVVSFSIEWRMHGFHPPGPMIESAVFGNYEVRIYQRHEENLVERINDRLSNHFSGLLGRIPSLSEWSGFEILKQGRLVYSQYGGEFRITEFGSKNVAGLDITGDGTPKLALTGPLGRQGGGAFMLFECGEHFRKIAMVESWGICPELRNLDESEIPVLVVSDNAFYHWPVCRDGEPMPEVILRWRDGRYVPARDLMIQPAPPQEELNSKAGEIRRRPEWNEPQGSAPVAEIAGTALALMYGGHEDLAWKFIKSAWKPEADIAYGNEDFFAEELRGRLDESEYWPNVRTRPGNK